METLEKAFNELTRGISKALKGLDRGQVERMIEALLEAWEAKKKVLVVGVGRSSLVGKAFAMRLMHLGFNVYVLGETITPDVGGGDLVLVVSGSGSTTLPVTVAQMARRLGAAVLAVTSRPDSPLGKTADIIVEVPGREKISEEDEYHARQLSGEHESLAPMGTMFEDTCMVFLDSVIAELMARLGLNEDALRKRHATIE